MTQYTMTRAEQWANAHSFNVRPSGEAFKAELLGWMEDEGFFFNDVRDAEKVWALFQQQIDKVREVQLERHKHREAQRDPTIEVLFRKPGLPEQHRRPGKRK